LREFEQLSWPCRIGLVADTHLVRPHPLPERLVEGLAACDLIFHAGDINREWVIVALARVAPVRAVVGNNDAGLERMLPEERYFQCGEHRIGLLHGWSPNASRPVTAKVWTMERMRGVVDCAVYGHSHRAEVAQREGLLMVNPGSPTQPRWAPRPTYGILEVRDGISARIVAL
jgi:putative phosphoesterase